MSLKVSRQRILDGATVVMVACALFLTSLVVRREFTTRNPASLINEVSDWKQYATAGHSLGPDDAAVTIVEFADFECTSCRRLSLYLDSLRALQTSIRVVYRHYPKPA